jgi:hypothetical protein
LLRVKAKGKRSLGDRSCLRDSSAAGKQPQQRTAPSGVCLRWRQVSASGDSSRTQGLSLRGSSQRWMHCGKCVGLDIDRSAIRKPRAGRDLFREAGLRHSASALRFPYAAHLGTMSGTLFISNPAPRMVIRRGGNPFSSLVGLSSGWFPIYVATPKKAGSQVCVWKASCDSLWCFRVREGRFERTLRIPSCRSTWVVAQDGCCQPRSWQ